MDEQTNPESWTVLDEILERHAKVFPYFVPAIELGHLAYEREREFAKSLIPGAPHIRRIRNDINDNCWRFMRVVGQPLIEAGLLGDIRDCFGGDVAVLPDGLTMRLKRATQAGWTANNMTDRRHAKEAAASPYIPGLFPKQSDLDMYIADGAEVDVVYNATQLLEADSFMPAINVMLKLGMREPALIVSIGHPDEAALRTVCPSAYDVIEDMRGRLSA
ncbi:MAG: hypothetical protein KIT54_06145 [Phycisphaeraceae bacterium]|nr:hypothetical protein [Phycisphaeraceae bacterium]